MNPLRVALSVDALTPQLTGIGRYCLELVHRLPADPRIESVAYFRGENWLEDPSTLLQKDVYVPAKARPWKRNWDRWRSHGRFRNSIVHAPNYFLPAWAELGVATVHDLSVFKYPETHPLERIKAFEASFSSTVQRAALILTDCEWIRREVIEFTGISGNRVRAVPLGVAPEFRARPLEVLLHMLAPLGLIPGTYGLCVSTLEPRKRIGLLLDAWQNLPIGIRTRYPLVLAGASGWDNEPLMRQIENGRRENWLKFLGFVPESLLPFLYAGARAFAYPSQYEGFGLPPLEAMACGVPTMIAGDNCLPEVTDGAALVVDPNDIENMVDAITQMLEDNDWRAQASSAGTLLTSRYSWPACIENTVGAYQSLLSESY